MPELPEVETARLLVERHCLGKKIIKVIGVESGGGPRTGQFDEIIHQGTLNAQTLEECLVGKTIESTTRKGKIQMWKLSGGQEATIHFGMTGSWSIEGRKGSEYVRYSVNTSNWPPKFTKLELIFSDNTRLALTDPRRLAKFRLSSNALNEPPVSDLAPDAYLELPFLHTFITSIRKKSTAIKALLLDQNAIVSGIGNWIIDEVLYQSAIHPETSCDAIDDTALARLHKAIIDVISFAVKVEAESDKFPKDWLFHYRWGKGKDGQKDAHGNSIKFETVGGRTSAVVTAIQGVAKKKVIKQKVSDGSDGDKGGDGDEGGDGDKGGSSSIVNESKTKKKDVDGTLAKKKSVSKAKKDIDGTKSMKTISDSIPVSNSVPDVLPVAVMKKTKKRKIDDVNQSESKAALEQSSLMMRPEQSFPHHRQSTRTKDSNAVVSVDDISAVDTTKKGKRSRSQSQKH